MKPAVLSRVGPALAVVLGCHRGPLRPDVRYDVGPTRIEAGTDGSAAARELLHVGLKLGPPVDGSRTLFAVIPESRLEIPLAQERPPFSCAAIVPSGVTAAADPGLVIACTPDADPSSVYRVGSQLVFKGPACGKGCPRMSIGQIPIAVDAEIAGQESRPCSGDEASDPVTVRFEVELDRAGTGVERSRRLLLQVPERGIRMSLGDVAAPVRCAGRAPRRNSYSISCAWSETSSEIAFSLAGGLLRIESESRSYDVRSRTAYPRVRLGCGTQVRWVPFRLVDPNWFPMAQPTACGRTQLDCDDACADKYRDDAGGETDAEARCRSTCAQKAQACSKR